MSVTDEQPPSLRVIADNGVRHTPADNAAEQAVLGAILTDPDLAPHLETHLEPDDFYQPRHETIWRAIHAVAATGQLPDPILVAGELHRTGELTRAGGAGYLADLMAACPLPAQAPHYATLVRDASRRRAIGTVATQLATLPDGADLDQAITHALDILDHAAARFGPRTSSTRYIAGDAFILDRPKEVPAIWGSGDNILWARGEAALIAGPAGVGKTTLAQQIVLAGIGIRDTVLGFPVQPLKRVLYIAADRPPQAARSLERMVTEDHRDALAEQLVIWKGPPPTDFAKHPDTLTEMCADVHADAVVIDALKDVALGLSDDEVGSALNSAIQRALVAGVEVLGLHHYRKRSQDHANREPTTLDELYGSTWITAGAGSVLSIWGHAGDLVVKLRHLKQPSGEFGPVDVTHDHEAGTTTVNEGPGLYDAIRWAGPHGLTPTGGAVATTGREKPTKNDVEKARRGLERLVRDGLAVRRDPEGKGRGREARYFLAARETT